MDDGYAMTLFHFLKHSSLVTIVSWWLSECLWCIECPLLHQSIQSAVPAKSVIFLVTLVDSYGSEITW